MLDLGGDVRANPKISGTKHNVFGIQTGVAISLMVKRKHALGCRILYARRPEFETAEEKLMFLSRVKLGEITFEEMRPDAKNNWIHVSNADLESLIPIASKETKSSKKRELEKAVFRSYSFGVVTNRDDWTYAESALELERKVNFLVTAYNDDLVRLGARARDQNIAALLNTSIKWTRAVKHDLARGVRYTFERERIVPAMYRPFVRRLLYFSPRLNEMPNLMPRYFGAGGKASNRAVVFTDPTSQKPFMVMSVDSCPDMHLVGAAAGSVVLPLLVDGEAGFADNITDWALDQFRKHYGSPSPRPLSPRGRGRRKAAEEGANSINKEAIFHYVYAVLHDPIYREKYALNLRREFPRIPFYADFWQWVDWGKELMDLHIGYKSVEPWPLTRIDLPMDGGEPAKPGKSKSLLAEAESQLPSANRKATSPKALLKANKAAGLITLDTQTTLSGVPDFAWDYKLGNRCALEWILDQYKEKKPKDPTIREKFNTYRFADYKEKVIDLLMRVTTVSVRTQEIVEAMKRSTR